MNISNTDNHYRQGVADYLQALQLTQTVTTTIRPNEYYGIDNGSFNYSLSRPPLSPEVKAVLSSVRDVFIEVLTALSSSKSITDLNCFFDILLTCFDYYHYENSSTVLTYFFNFLPPNLGRKEYSHICNTSVNDVITYLRANCPYKRLERVLGTPIIGKYITVEAYEKWREELLVVECPPPARIVPFGSIPKDPWPIEVSYAPTIPYYVNYEIRTNSV